MADRAADAASSTEGIPAGHASPTAAEDRRGSPAPTGLAGLSVAALGIVFGDIGRARSTPFGSALTPSAGWHSRRVTCSACYR
jgi:hypothetical protein